MLAMNAGPMNGRIRLKRFFRLFPSSTLPALCAVFSLIDEGRIAIHPPFGQVCVQMLDAFCVAQQGDEAADARPLGLPDEYPVESAEPVLHPDVPVLGHLERHGLERIGIRRRPCRGETGKLVPEHGHGRVQVMIRALRGARGQHHLPVVGQGVLDELVVVGHVARDVRLVLAGDSRAPPGHRPG